MIQGLKEGLGVIPFFATIIFSVVLIIFVIYFALGALQSAANVSGFSAEISTAMNDSVTSTITLTSLLYNPLTVGVSLLIVVVIIAIFGWLLYKSGKDGGNDMGY